MFYRKHSFSGTGAILGTQKVNIMGDKSRNLVPLLLLLLLSLLLESFEMGRISSAVVVDDGTLSDWDNVTVTYTDFLGDSPIDMTDLVFVGFDFDDTWLYVRWDIDNDGTKPAVLYDMGINITASGTTWDIFVAAQIERISGTPVLTNISIRDAADTHLWNATDDGSMIEDGTLYFDPPPGGTPGTISVEARFPLSYITSTTGLIFSQFRSHSSIQVTSNEKDMVPDSGYIVLSLDDEPPEMGNLSDTPDPQSSGGNVNITVDVIDDYNVESVWVNVIYPDSTWANMRMLQGVGDEWFLNISYIVFGFYSYTVWANDSSDNWNSTDPGTFDITCDFSIPELSNLLDFPNPQIPGGNVNITVDVTDNIGVSSVWANITFPDATWNNVTMTKGSGDGWYYNASYSDLGLYSFTVWANDPSENWNTTGPGSFTIQDDDGPHFSNIDHNPDPQENGGYVNVTVDVTDNVAVDMVWINVTYPDASWLNVSMIRGAGDGWYYEISYAGLGIYSYTIWAKDSSDNWNYSAQGFFTIQDTDGPSFSDLEANPDIQISEGYVNISVSIIDDIGVNDVYIIIPYPDGGQINASMNKGIGDTWYYNMTYYDPGVFYYSVHANDTNNNWNSSETLTFEILSSDYPPTIWPPNAYPNPQQVGQLVNITVRVTDEVGVDEVWVTIIYPGGTWQNLSMFPADNNGWYYRNAYLALNDYYYIIWAKDVGGQWNSSGANSFTIHDLLPPILDNINDSPDPGEIGESVTISVDVFDDVVVDEVWVDIRYPNGTWVNVSMGSDGSQTWFVERPYLDQGLYLYVIWASDICGNLISSDSETFMIQDKEGPIIIDTFDEDDEFKEGEEINITVEVFDNVGINGVWINISFPDERWLIVSMNPGPDNQWYYTSDFDTSGEFTYTILAVDLCGNWNITEPEVFRVEPQEAPPKTPRFGYMMLLLIYWPFLLILLAIILVRWYESENRIKRELYPIVTALNNSHVASPTDLRSIKNLLNICQKMGIPIEEVLLTLHNEGCSYQIESTLSSLLIR